MLNDTLFLEGRSTEVFQTYVKEVVDQIVSTDVQDVEALKNEKWVLNPSMTVADKHAAMVAKIGENMNIRRFAKINTEGHIVPCRWKDWCIG